MALSDDQIASLRRWAAAVGPYMVAAVELLSEHGTWLRRQDFTDKCVCVTDDGAYINWAAATDLYPDLVGSSTELAILDFAIALGRDRFRFHFMGPAHSAMLIRAVTTTLA